MGKNTVPNPAVNEIKGETICIGTDILPVGNGGSNITVNEIKVFSIQSII